MFKKLNKVTSFLLLPTLLITAATSVYATPPEQMMACEQHYVVQADDWLSKLADKYYGHVLAYPAIVEATNAAAQADSSYVTIANPDLIEIGWKLCIPSAADAEALMSEEMMGEEMEPMTEMTMGGETSFNVRIENVGDFKFKSSGAFNTPVGATEPGPLLPGSVYEFAFNASPGDHLSFAAMFVHSNDWFIGPGSAGIALYDEDGSPITGDVTGQIQLWDAGTELDQEPGLGVDQPLQQAGPNTGEADPDNSVRLVGDEFGNLPAVSDMVRVTLDSPAANNFVLRIENLSDESTLAASDGNTHPTPFAPGVWVVHVDEGPLFTEGAPDYGQGLEALAEDGDPSGLAEALASQSGLSTPFAPGAWAVHTAPDPLFSAGQADGGEGLEALAEDGDPSGLAAAVANRAGVSASGVFNTPVGATEPGPLLPGQAYEFTFEAVPGDKLSFATMFVQSNDLFYAPDGAGIALFKADGTPIMGDVTAQVALWDAGTEVNQQPDFGPDQAPRQVGPNTGPDEMGVVQIVADDFTYPGTSDTIRVTISVAESKQ